jgi:eukaryotic-like serine/threonine-protein kinase
MKSYQAEQYKQIKLLFFRLKDQDISEQKKYLDSNCKDQQIRAGVEALLFNYKKADDNWPEQKSESETGSAFVNAVENIEPYLSLIPKLKSSSSVETISKEFLGTSRFLIQKPLGAGGFGVVYQVFDRERNATVALKSLHKNDALGLYRFKKEFRTLVDITHPNLVTLYELLSQEDQWFFTMEIINGSNFIDYVKLSESQTANHSPHEGETIPAINKIRRSTSNTQGLFTREEEVKPRVCPSDLGKLYSALKQLVEGLLVLHQANRLHQDIKPSNVLVTKEGRVVILDFGLASELNPQVWDNSSDGNIFGTPTYMSPEQALGQVTTTKSDWYSVGVMLYEALTGELPFVGSPIEILLKKQRYEPLMVSEFIPEIPAALNSLCQSLLQKDPQLRPTGEEILRIIKSLDEKDPSQTDETQNKKQIAEIFVGREKELIVLGKARDLTRQGETTTIFVKGCSGIGKSSLVNRFLEQLYKKEESILVFAARCYEQESIPYKVFDSLVDQISHYLMGLSNLEREALLPLDIQALARLFPVFSQVEVIANQKPGNENLQDPLEVCRLAFGGLKELLVRLAEKQDLILFIDDLQWGDLDSVGLLKEILSPPNTPRLLLIGAYRSEGVENSHFLQALFADQAIIDKQFEYGEIELDGLSGLEAKSLAGVLLGKNDSQERREKIAQESQGSPFFIGQFARYLMESESLNKKETENVKMTIERVINSNLDNLSIEGRRLLEIVAVAGQPVPPAVVTEAAQLGNDEKLFVILRGINLLRSTGAGVDKQVDTYHDKIREVVMAGLREELVKNYHNCLANAFERREKLDLERLSKHFRLAGQMDKAFYYILRAAEQAEKALAFDRAAELYEQILELGVTINSAQNKAIKIGLANALANAGKGIKSAKAYLAASENCSGLEQLKFQRKAGEQLLNAGRIDEGLEILNRILEKVGIKLNKNKLLTLLSILFGRCKLWLRGMSYQECSESEVLTEDLVRIDACFNAVDSLISLNVLQAFELQTKHLLYALSAGEPYRLTRAFLFEIIFTNLSSKRSIGTVSKLIERAEMLIQKTNNSESKAMANFVQCGRSVSQGDWKKGWNFFSVGEEITLKECIGENYGVPLRGIDNTVAWGLRSLFYQGEMKELLERLPKYLREAQDRNNLLVLRSLGTYIVYLKYLAEDSPAVAVSQLDKMDSLWIAKVFDIHDFWKILAKTEIGLYSSKARDTWNPINYYWSEQDKPQLFYNPMVLVETLHCHARAALLMAKNQTDPKPFLTIAEKTAGKIKKMGRVYGDGWADLILAGVEAIKGRVESAIDYLNLAEIKLTRADMKLYAIAASRRRGELLAGDAGGDLIKKSDDWMLAQQIKNPAQMADMLTPGSWTAPKNKLQ